MRAKIGDFGFAMQIPECASGKKSFIHTSMVCGTTGYVAPEIHRGEMGPKSDVFSFGVVRLWKYMYIHVHVQYF